MFSITLTNVEASLDYIRVRADHEGDREIAWKLWNDHLEVNEESPAAQVVTKSSKMRRMHCCGMGIMYSRTGPVFLSIPAGALSMPLNHPLISTLSVNRTDIQVSGSVSEAQPGLARRLYQWWTEAETGKTSRMKSRLIESQTGQTVYLGRRESPRFLRVYDKGGEQETHPLGVRWRFELETKRELADTYWKLYWKAKDPAQQCFSFVHEHLRQVRVQVYPEPHEGCASAKLRPSPSTDQTALDWLKHSAGPVVARMVRKGYAEDVHRVLGLNWKGD